MNGKSHIIFGYVSMVFVTLMLGLFTSILGIDVVPAVGFVTVAFGALFLDIDGNNTIMRNRFRRSYERVKYLARVLAILGIFALILKLLSIFGILVGLPINILFIAISCLSCVGCVIMIMGWTVKHLTHRGITHTLLIPLIVLSLMILVSLFPLNIYLEAIIQGLLLGVLVGALSHLLSDIMNRGGIPILWPFKYYYRDSKDGSRKIKRYRLARFKSGRDDGRVLLILSVFYLVVLVVRYGGVLLWRVLN